MSQRRHVKGRAHVTWIIQEARGDPSREAASVTRGRRGRPGGSGLGLGSALGPGHVAPPLLSEPPFAP